MLNESLLKGIHALNPLANEAPTAWKNALFEAARVTGATTSFTCDTCGRIRTVTESDSYTVMTDYDLLDRPTKRERIIWLTL
jgi:hypothetical protein